MASVERHRDAWRVRWRDHNAQQHSKSFRRKMDATAFAATVEADKHRGVGLDPAGARTTFDAYAAAWAARQVWAPRTRETTVANLRGLPFGGKPLANVRRADIEAWVADMSGRLAPTTVDARYRSVVTVFRAAKRDRLVHDPLPTEGVRLPRDDSTPATRAVALSPATLTALLDALPGPGTTWADYALTIALTGLRPSEAAGITADRIQGGDLVVDRQLGRDYTLVPLKTRASIRTLPLGDRALEILTARPPHPDGFVFVSRTGRPLSQPARTGAWGIARDALAGTATPLPATGKAWHSLRHTYASTALAAGMDPATLSRMLGHATVAETLTTYSHALPGAMAAQRNTVADALGL